MNKTPILAGVLLAALAPLAGAQTVSPSADAAVVVRDAETGALRAATPAELATLQASRRATALRAPVERPLQKLHASGALGVRVTSDFMSYSVLVRQPDGKLVEQCFDSKEAAEAAARGGAFAKPVSITQQLPTE